MSSVEDMAIAEAKRILQNSYSPYSGFKVGASLVSVDDRIFAGTNVENSSYGLTICAERAALTRAVSEGIREFKLLVLVSEGNKCILPCGACLQVLSEFCQDLKIISITDSGETKLTTLKEIFPAGFRL